MFTSSIASFFVIRGIAAVILVLFMILLHFIGDAKEDMEKERPSVVSDTTSPALS